MPVFHLRIQGTVVLVSCLHGPYATRRTCLILVFAVVSAVVSAAGIRIEMYMAPRGKSCESFHPCAVLIATNADGALEVLIMNVCSTSISSFI